MSEKRNLLLQSIRDFLTPEILKFALLPFVLSIVIMYGLFFMAADYGIEQLQQASLQIEQTQTTMQDGHPHTETVTAEYEGSSILAFLLKYSITSWLLSFLIYTVGSFFVLLFSVVIALAIIGFLTEPILKVVRNRHYPGLELVGHGHIGSIIWAFVKSFLIMLLMLLVLIPFYFVPLLNIFALNLPFYYFFHKLMVFDVASTINSKEEYAMIHVHKANTLRLKTLFMYLLSLIPFAVLLITPFYVIYLGHTLMSETIRLRSNDKEEPVSTDPSPTIEA